MSSKHARVAAGTLKIGAELSGNENYLRNRHLKNMQHSSYSIQKSAYFMYLCSHYPGVYVSVCPEEK
jgi:hypothetical protein